MPCSKCGGNLENSGCCMLCCSACGETYTAGSLERERRKRGLVGFLMDRTKTFLKR